MAVPNSSSDFSWQYTSINGKPITEVASQQVGNSCAPHSLVRAVKYRHKILFARSGWGIPYNFIVPTPMSTDGAFDAPTVFPPIVNWFSSKGLHLEGVHRPRVEVGGFMDIPPIYHNELIEELIERGPFVIGFQLLSDFWTLQEIYEAKGIDEGGFYHAAVVVGCGYKNGRAFWIFENSWGPEWGQEGKHAIYADCVLKAIVPTFPLC